MNLDATLDPEINPAHVVMRRLRTVLREALKAGPNPSVQAPLVLALRIINEYLGD